MKSPWHVLALAALALVPGCIASDDVTTLTVGPDGSADLAQFSSNIRSTETGSKADEELRQYVDAFDQRQGSDFVGIVHAGGKILDTWWIRRDAPYSNIISARLPNADALEKWCTIEGGEGETRLTTRFSHQGATRTLSMFLQPPKDLKAEDLISASVKDSR